MFVGFTFTSRSLHVHFTSLLESPKDRATDTSGALGQLCPWGPRSQPRRGPSRVRVRRPPTCPARLRCASTYPHSHRGPSLAAPSSPPLSREKSDDVVRSIRERWEHRASTHPIADRSPNSEPCRTATLTRSRATLTIPTTVHATMATPMATGTKRKSTTMGTNTTTCTKRAAARLTWRPIHPSSPSSHRLIPR